MTMLKPNRSQVAVLRGGGDLATGVAQALWRAGMAVVILESAMPLAIRRTVALCSAMYEGVFTVEDMTARRVDDPQDCAAAWERAEIPLLADERAESLALLQPTYLVDAIIAKKNLNTHRGMAPVTVALGPGFSAPDDVDAVVETMRGHDLGRLILRGSALPNTGIPGILGGKSAQRVVHAPHSGRVKHIHSIGDRVEAGEPLFSIDGVSVSSPLTGTLRGLIAEGLRVPAGLKCADVDPRPAEEVDWMQISDKARSLGGAALTACLFLARKKGLTSLCGEL